jgi:arylsulfatase A-like enzyme
MAATGEVDAKLLDPGGPAGRLGIDRAGRGAPTAQRDRDPDLMVEEGIGFLRRNKDRPFFLYFAINEPHYAYQGDPKWLQRYAQLNYPRNVYTAFLSTMDERIGRLMAELGTLGLRERTIVIVQSDHGHSTEDRAHFGGGSAGPYRGAKLRLHLPKVGEVAVPRQ